MNEIIHLLTRSLLLEQFFLNFRLFSHSGDLIAAKNVAENNSRQTNFDLNT